MPKIQYKTAIVTRVLENETFISEGVLLPDYAYYSDSEERSRTTALKLVGGYMDRRMEEGLQDVPFPDSFDSANVQVEVAPPVVSPAWKKPVLLSFEFVSWKHGDSMSVAYVPAFGIAVMAEKPELLEKRVASHIKFALFRTGGAESLWKLVNLQRAACLKVKSQSMQLNLEKAKRKAKKLEEEKESDEIATLKSVADDMSMMMRLPKMYESGHLVRRVAEALTGARGSSVLLVGPSGVGKTAIVHQLVSDSSLYGLEKQNFFATTGSRLVAGMGGFGMWQERLRSLCKEAVNTKTILHVGGLVELMEVGKSIRDKTGMASFLRPYLLKGDLTIIAECLPEEIPFIERQDSHLLRAFKQIDIEEPDEIKARDILLNVALEHSVCMRNNLEVITEDAIDLLDRLHRRYTTYSAYPGRPVRFLTNLIQDAAGKATVDTNMVLESFSRETGIPSKILDDSVSLGLADTARWFEDRVMGQPEAVRKVTDVLAIVKSRLGRSGKPLASMLFIGPTGVGKTEMSKALAEFLFGDKGRLVRFDMSEYADATGAERLIGGTAEGEGLLTGKLREQPFSVVLLDEFEKAHPKTYDLLLQVFGEGRLSDVRGRVADFRNALIIMTSNLGAESYRQSKPGFSVNWDESSRSREHFTGAVRGFLRPEMFNRIDSIVSFSPLDKETVLRIAERELSLVARRDGLGLRGVNLKVGEEVAGFLSEKAFDPRYGAREIKRTVEDKLVAPLASRLNAYSAEIPLAAAISVESDRIKVEVSSEDGSAQKRRTDTAANLTLQTIASECTKIRRQALKLNSSGAMMEIENDIYRFERVKKRAKRRLLGENTQPPREINLLPDLQKIAEAAEGFQNRAFGLEEMFLESYYQKEDMDISAYTRELGELRQELNELLSLVFKRQFEHPDRALIGLFSDRSHYMANLAESYLLLSLDMGDCNIKAQRVSVAHDSSRGKRVLVRSDIKDIKEFLAQPIEGTIGVIIEINVEMAFPMFYSEDGLHTFKGNNAEKVLVQVVDSDIKKYVPPSGIEMPNGIRSNKMRRMYDPYNRTFTEPLLKRSGTFNPVYLFALIKERLRFIFNEKMFGLIDE